MKEEALLEALRQIKTIVDDALAGDDTSARHRRPSPTSPQKSERPDSLTCHILALRNSNFFSQPKTYNEVHAEMESHYPCDADRVKVACFRLQKRKELRKTSKSIGSKSQIAYVW
jgi:hypothetical protein